MRRLIHGNAAEYELENHARQYSGSIRDDGLRKVLQVKLHLKKCFV
jgi:general secretion pathway protein E